MSKATKLRTKAQNKKQNKEIQSLLKKKLLDNSNSLESITETTLSNGQKGLTLTFDVLNKKK